MLRGPGPFTLFAPSNRALDDAATALAAFARPEAAALLYQARTTFGVARRGRFAMRAPVAERGARAASVRSFWRRTSRWAFASSAASRSPQL